MECVIFTAVPYDDYQLERLSAFRGQLAPADDIGLALTRKSIGQARNASEPVREGAKRALQVRDWLSQTNA
jgi:hypothetical protein